MQPIALELGCEIHFNQDHKCSHKCPVVAGCIDKVTYQQTVKILTGFSEFDDNFLKLHNKHLCMLMLLGSTQNKYFDLIDAAMVNAQLLA